MESDNVHRQRRSGWGASKAGKEAESKHSSGGGQAKQFGHINLESKWKETEFRESLEKWWLRQYRIPACRNRTL